MHPPATDAQAVVAVHEQHRTVRRHKRPLDRKVGDLIVEDGVGAKALKLSVHVRCVAERARVETERPDPVVLRMRTRNLDGDTQLVPASRKRRHDGSQVGFGSA
jgi:hypothetical protein